MARTTRKLMRRIIAIFYFQRVAFNSNYSRPLFHVYANIVYSVLQGQNTALEDFEKPC